MVSSIIYVLYDNWVQRVCESSTWHSYRHNYGRCELWICELLLRNMDIKLCTYVLFWHTFSVILVHVDERNIAIVISDTRDSRLSVNTLSNIHIVHILQTFVHSTGTNKWSQYKKAPWTAWYCPIYYKHHKSLLM